MTEADWLTCTETWQMLEFLQGQVSDRKLRLFACACCRHVWHLLTDERCRWAVEAAEQYADGKVGEEFLREANETARAVVREKQRREGRTIQAENAAWWATRPVRLETAKDVQGATAAPVFALVNVFEQEMLDPIPPATFSRARRTALKAAAQTAEAALADLLRCIVGNPFRPVTVDPLWRTPSVQALARTIYEERSFDGLPIIADALEDAGCTDTEILNHCRGPGPHVRGCWIIDLLLGKE